MRKINNNIIPKLIMAQVILKQEKVVNHLLIVYLKIFRRPFVEPFGSTTNMVWTLKDFWKDAVNLVYTCNQLSGKSSFPEWNMNRLYGPTKSASQNRISRNQFHLLTLNWKLPACVDVMDLDRWKILEYQLSNRRTNP